MAADCGGTVLGMLQGTDCDIEAGVEQLLDNGVGVPMAFTLLSRDVRTVRSGFHRL